METWQIILYAVGGVLTVTGLSAAPWISALLRRKLITIGEHEEGIARERTAGESRADDLKAEIARIVEQHGKTIDRITEEKLYERSAKDVERARSDEATKTLSEVAQEFGATTVHLLEGLRQGEKP